VLISEPGDGKTAVVEGMTNRIFANDDEIFPAIISLI
jgi:ATP-dependent Clp protease ATP-binding subunit ClpA